jgi:hypothetical protein
MKRLEPTNLLAEQRWTRRRQLAMREHANRSLRRALALALVDHLEQVAITLRQTPDVNTYMVAAAGMARVLVVLSLGARQLESPLPPGGDWRHPGAAPLGRERQGASTARRPGRRVLVTSWRIGSSEPALPHPAPKRGSPEAGLSRAPWPRAHPRSPKKTPHAPPPACS